MRNLPPEAKNGIIELLNKTVADQLQFLLEKKHLYQSITIDIKPILGLGASYTDRGRDDRAVSQLLDRARLSPSDQPSFVANTDGTQTPDFQLLLNHVKLFCKKCDSREAFVPIWFRDITNELLKPSIREVSLSSVPSNDFQLFVITYQCQRCTGKPDVFIIRREGWKLMLDGRSPMEEVELPPFIPKQEKRLFRDALIAIHGGK